MRDSFLMYIEERDRPRLRRRGTALRLGHGKGLARRLFVIHTPENLADIGLLGKDRHGAPATRWRDMPVYQRARRATIHGAVDTFVGCDSVYADFGRLRIEARTRRLNGTVEVRGRSCVVVGSASQDPALPRAKPMSPLDQANALRGRLEYFDEKGQLARVGTVDEIASIDGWPTPLNTSMTNELAGSRSVIKLPQVRYDAGLDPDLFPVESLGQARNERWLLDAAAQNEQRDLDPQRTSTTRGKI